MRIPPKTKAWLKRIGWIGFLFFMVKGILWLIVGKTIIGFFTD